MNLHQSKIVLNRNIQIKVMSIYSVKRPFHSYREACTYTKRQKMNLMTSIHENSMNMHTKIIYVNTYSLSWVSPISYNRTKWDSKTGFWLTCPPMEMPVKPRGPNPWRWHQCRRARDSRIRAPPITKRSLTLWRLDRLWKETNEVTILSASAKW